MDLRSSAEYANQRAIDQVEYIHPFVRPLMVPNGLHDVLPIGTCVLMWHRGRRYIVTAAHVLRLAPESVPYIGTASRWAPLPGPYRSTVATGPALRPIDRHDFAYREITELEAHGLDGCRFLSGDRVATGEPRVSVDQLRPAYLVFGYPLNRINLDRHARETSPNYLTYTGNLVNRETSDRHQLDPASHLYLHFDDKAAHGPAGPQRAPKLDGISGGGIFRFTAGESLGDIGLPRLAGITTEHLRAQDLLAGIRIDVVLRAIDDRL